jgi:glycosyltransferase involved in cell wall biosynthesis
MRILFIHQNMPGQFAHLIQHLRRDGTHQVACITARRDFTPPAGVGRVVYEVPPAAIPPNLFVSPLETAVRHGVQVARACEALRGNGYRPDLIVAHPGWGESLYVKDVFPQVPVLLYCEFFYRSHGADVNFDPAEQQDLMANCVTRTRNAPQLLALDSADWGYSPTQWQRLQFPADWQQKISVAFDGIDTEAIQPDAGAAVTLSNGVELRAGQEIVTYVARGLEPYRGFPQFFRALPAILAARPDAHAVIVGGNETVYGKPPAGGGTWRERLQEEVAVDPERVHFVGLLPRDHYRRLLQVSAAHVYLTVPFVLSWSMLEAMAAGCLVVGSATPPVREMIEHGRNGVLVDFFDPGAIAEAVVQALADPEGARGLRQAARWTALSQFSLDVCLPRQVALLERVGGWGSS